MCHFSGLKKITSKTHFPNSLLRIQDEVHLREKKLFLAQLIPFPTIRVVWLRQVQRGQGQTQPIRKSMLIWHQTFQTPIEFVTHQKKFKPVFKFSLG